MCVLKRSLWLQHESQPGARQGWAWASGEPGEVWCGYDGSSTDGERLPLKVFRRKSGQTRRDEGGGRVRKGAGLAAGWLLVPGSPGETAALGWEGEHDAGCETSRCTVP